LNLRPSVYEEGIFLHIIGTHSNFHTIDEIKKSNVFMGLYWLRGQDLNLRPSGYEPDELPGCSTPRQYTGPKAEISGNLGLHR
jgi:hypothetical protein